MSVLCFWVSKFCRYYLESLSQVLAKWLATRVHQRFKNMQKWVIGHFQVHGGQEPLRAFTTSRSPNELHGRYGRDGSTQDSIV